MSRPCCMVFAVLLWAPWLTACGSDPIPYAPCRSASACVEARFGEGCYRLRLTRTDGSEAAGGVCSRACEQDADCPEDGLCIALSSDPTGLRFCVAACTQASDCLAPHRCTPLADEGEGLHACLP